MADWWSTSPLAEDDDKWWNESPVADQAEPVVDEAGQAQAARAAALAGSGLRQRQVGGGRGFINPPMADPSKPLKSPAAPYRNRTEALDDAVNLIEEGLPAERVFDAFSQAGISQQEILSHGTQRGSAAIPAAPARGPLDARDARAGDTGQPEITGTVTDQPVGFVEDKTNALRRGVEQARGFKDGIGVQLGTMDAGTFAVRAADRQRRIDAALPSEDTAAALERLARANDAGWNATTEALLTPSNWGGLSAMLLESAIASAPTIAAGAIGSIAAGPVGAGVGAGLGSLAIEAGSAIGETLQKRGADPRDALAIRRTVEDPAFMEEARERALRRGIPVAVFDGISAGFAGRFLGAVTRAQAAGVPVGRAAFGIAAAKEAGLQVGAGMAGEAAGQLAVGESKPLDVIVEGLAEVPGGAFEVAANMLRAGRPALQPGPVAPLMTDAANIAGAAPASVPPAPPPGIVAGAMDVAPAPPPKPAGPAATSFTPPGSLSGQMGLTPIVIPNIAPAPAADAPAGTAPTGLVNTEVERAFGLDALRMPGADPATTAAPASAGSEQNISLPQPTAGTAPAEPAATWFGRRGDGYQTEADAQQALPGRERRDPALSWSVEQMPSGKYRLAGYAVGEAARVSPSTDPLRAQGEQTAAGSDTAPASVPATAAAPTTPTGLAQGTGGAVSPAAGVSPLAQSTGAPAAQGAVDGQGSGAASLGVAVAPGAADQSAAGAAGAGDRDARSAGLVPGVAPGGAPAFGGADADAVQRDLVAIQDSRLKLGEATKLEVVDPETVNNLSWPQRIAGLFRDPVGVALGRNRRARSADVALATGLAGSLRAPIVFVRDRNGKARFNAVTINGRLYMNVDGDAPIVALAFHEVTHNLPKDLRDKLTRTVMETVTPKQRAEFLRQFPGYRALPAQKQDEELTARIIEQDGQNRSIWRKLRDRLGDDEFGKLAGEILKVIDRIMAAFKRENSSEFTTDIEKVRNAVVDVMAEARGRIVAGEAQARAAAGEAQDRPVDDEALPAAPTADVNWSNRRAGARGEPMASEERGPASVQAGESVVDGIMFSNQKRNLKDAPDIDFADLVGSRVVGIKADLTDAGRSFTGIDGSALQFPIELMGGPGYPRLKDSWKKKLIWAVRGGGTLSKIMNKVMESDYVIVHAMNDRSHLTNTTVSQGYIDLVRAYLRDGRISKENLLALDAIVKSEKNKASFPDFPGFESPTIATYIDALSFDRRGALATILEKKEAQSHGLPNLDKYRRSVLDAEYAGYRQGDAMLVLKVDKKNPTIKLGTKGTKLHPSYPLALRGTVVGKLSKGVNYELIYDDYFRDTVPGFANGMDGAWYGFDRSMPIQEITPEIAARVSRGKYSAIASPRQAQAALAVANERWLVSGKTKAEGGVSIQEFVDALAANDGSPALTLYSADEVKAGVKAGTFSVYQLGTEGGPKGLQVFFGLKRGAPWYKGVIDANVSDSEVELVSVTNNEVGAPAVGIPAIITMAIKQGATILDAYAVKGDRFPAGFLPEMYGQFGFEAIGTVPFNEQYVVDKTNGMSDDEHARLTKLKLADLKEFWKSGGWKEGDGYPDVVVMRWSGKDEDRAGAVERYVRAGETGVPGRVPSVTFAAADQADRERDVASDGQRGPGRADSAQAGRDQGAGDAASVVRRAYGSIQELAGLSDGEVKNLGLDPKEIARLRERLADGAIVASPTSVVQFSEKRAAPADRIRWRKLADVKAELSLDNIPAHITPFATFMRGMAIKAQNGGLTARDVIKAYTIARSSMNRQAVSTQKVVAAGLQLPRGFNDPTVRPEGAFGFWLLSPIGQQYLNAAEVGITDQAAIDDAVSVMAPFGTQNTLGDDLARAAGGDLHKRLPAMTAAIGKAAAGKNAVKDWQEATSDLYGIRAAKQGFLGSLLGFGQLPTFDARQINLQVKPATKKDTLQALGSTRAREVVAKLARRMDALQLGVDPQFSPFYRHLAHHAVWDAVGKTQTTHSDVIDAMVQASERRADVTPLGFYSELARAAERGPGTAMPDQWRGFIRGLTGKGVKDEEITWSGIEEWLGLQQGKVPRQAVVDYLRGTGVQVEEVALGERAPLLQRRIAGENIREILEAGQVFDDDAQSALNSWLTGTGRIVSQSADRLDGYLEDAGETRTINEILEDAGVETNAPKYDSYVLPGGEYYRELLLKLPISEEEYVVFDIESKREVGRFPASRQAAAEALASADPINLDVRRDRTKRNAAGEREFRSSHWDHGNVLAHIRVNDRTDSTGAKVFFVEELQSDWAQEGRKTGFDNPPMKGEVRRQEGYDPAAADMFEPEDTGAERWAVYWENGTFSGGFGSRAEAEARLRDAAQMKAGGVPRAPFVQTTDSWLQLALKRVILKAVEEGADRVAFVTGAQAAERFRLDNQVRSIEWNGYDSRGATKLVSIEPLRGNTIELPLDAQGRVIESAGTQFDGKTIDEVIGKEFGERIMSERSGSLAGDGLRLEAKGMRKFYDVIVPTAANKLLKKLGGGKMTTVTVPAAEGWEGEPGRAMDDAIVEMGVADGNLSQQPGFDITPEVRSAAEQGLPLFSERRTPEASPFAGWNQPTKTPRISPSLELTRLVGRLDDGEITNAQFEMGVRMLTGRVVRATRTKQDNRAAAERVRGADIVREKLLAARRRDQIDPQDVEFAMWLLGNKPELADDLGASVRTPRADAEGVSGRYSPAARVIFLFKQRSNPDTTVHEILHHTERMMPQRVQDGIAEEWSKTFAQAYVSATPETRAALNDMLGQLVVASAAGQRTIVDHFANGTLTYDDHYALVNPSEFWAVNATRIMGGRYQAQGSWVGMARVWMRELMQKARGLLGLRSDAPVLRGLDSVMKGDATFQSAEMLSRRMGLSAQASRDIARESTEPMNPGSMMFSERRAPDTSEFQAWFRDSKVVDENGEPLVVYRGGTPSNVIATEGGSPGSRQLGPGAYFGGKGTAQEFADYRPSGQVDAYYLSLQQPFDETRRRFAAPEPMMAAFRDRLRDLGVPGIDVRELDVPYRGALTYLAKQLGKKRGVSGWQAADDINAALREVGFDGIIADWYEGGEQYVAFHSTQIKSATDNDGSFDVDDPDIMSSLRRQPATAQPTGVRPMQTQVTRGATFYAPDESRLDTFVYNYQDKQIDLKRVVEQVNASPSTTALTDRTDAYLREELYHGRVAERTDRFLEEEVKPLIVELRNAGVSLPDFEKYLHARHAQERNAAMRAINPTMPNNAALSGMSDQDAQAILANAAPVMQTLAQRVDDMIEATRVLMEVSGTETPAALAAVRGAYQFYVPLYREEGGADAMGLLSAGSGFSVKGTRLERAIGSNEAVQNILARVVEARENAITRAEKNLVSQAVYAMARDNPNDFLWSIEPPTERVLDERQNVFDPAQQRMVPNPTFGQVISRTNPNWKNDPLVVIAKINGQDVGVRFNERNPRAVRMAASLKNLDVSSLEGMNRAIGSATRWLASVNTQYNPVFAVANFVRDTQAVAFANLQSTEIADRLPEVMGNIPVAMRAIWRAERGVTPSNPTWDALYEEFTRRGGKTGFRQSFPDIDARAERLQKEFDKLDRSRPARAITGLLELVNAGNDAIENAVRLSAYKAALDAGMSKDRSASLAKNLTVNFNRKGAKTQWWSTYYAFFNAAIQGNARLMQSLLGKHGGKIIAGGLTLGVMQGLLYAGLDEEDEEKIPDFVKNTSWVLPLHYFGKNSYIAVPMPLGLNVLPNLGRAFFDTAHAFHEGKKQNIVGKTIDFISAIADAVNPLGSSQTPMQMAAPTVLDPFVQLSQNQDFTGKPLYRGRSDNDPAAPGYSLGRESTNPIYKGAAYVIHMAANNMNPYRRDTSVPAALSPQPEALRLIPETIGGGIWRETEKLIDSLTNAITGKPVDVARVPLAGRFYGDLDSLMSEQSVFYRNMNKVREAERELSRAKKDGEKPSPLEGDVVRIGRLARKEVDELREELREADTNNNRAARERIEGEMKKAMSGFNKTYRESIEAERKRQRETTQ